MRTIRRIYFYAVALISLEVVIWGSISLLRSLFASPQLVSGGDVLARALALILVGIPVFTGHWLWVQRTAMLEEEERNSPIRALFLYTALLVTLIPAAQNLLALINRLFYAWGGLNSTDALLGGQQTWFDNLIAILINGLIAVYLFHVLRQTWATLSQVDLYAGIRRLYRYLWLLYSLILTIFGIQQLLQFVLYVPTATVLFEKSAAFYNGLSLTLVGLPLWYFTWRICQKATRQREERYSYLRLGMLFLLTLAGMAVTLVAGDILLAHFLRWTLGEALTPAEFLALVSGPLSIGLPAAVVWAYYGFWLKHDLQIFPDETRRQEILRLYFYLRSLTGLGITFVGVSLLGSFLINSLIGHQVWGDILRASLSNAIALLAIGLPLWLRTWLPMQEQAHASGMTGDLARRSWIRKGYLYLALFLALLGGMFTFTAVIFRPLQALLGDQSLDRVAWVNSIKDAGLFLVVLFYHLHCLRADGAETARALFERHAAFHVLAFAEPGSPLASVLPIEIEKHAPGMRLTVVNPQVVEYPFSPPPHFPPVRAVVLPSDLAVIPPRVVQTFLTSFQGPVLIASLEQPRILWIGGSKPVESVAMALRQMSEGQEVRPSTGTSPWMIVVYLFAALFGLQLLMFLLALGISLTSID